MKKEMQEYFPDAAASAIIRPQMLQKTLVRMTNPSLSQFMTHRNLKKQWG